jgi:alpha-beta hydrolase superfamily lysophospholipase
MKHRFIIGLLAAALTAALALPVRVGPAGAQGAGSARPGSTGEYTETRLPGHEVRAGEPGSFRVGLWTSQAPVADLVFLHGHADRIDNHKVLFTTWAQAGLNVIAADLPSHGNTTVRSIDAWSSADLAAVVAVLERRYGTPQRPLILAGWSFGGLATVRTLQAPDRLEELSRRPSAAVLLTPAVDPLPLTGGDGIARRRTLTHDVDPAAAPPRPASPLQNPVFAVRLLADAWASRAADLPRDIPTLVVASDPADDVYVNAAGLVAWAGQQRAHGGTVKLLACSGARHAVELEPWPTGPTVRDATVRFLASVVPGIAADAGAVVPPVSSREQTCHAK